MICSQVFIYSESTVHAHFTHNYGTQARNYFELVHKKYPQEKELGTQVRTKSTHKRKEQRSLNSVHKYVHRETFFELSTQVRTQKYPQEKELGTLNVHKSTHKRNVL